MSRFLPNLNSIKAFEAAGRCGSFTGAAKELSVSHAAISRHVRGLEKQLGVQLFKLVAQGVELTEAGQTFLASLTPALERISAVSETIRNSNSEEISISCEPTFAAKWLMPHINDFQNEFPNYQLKLVASPELADIRNLEFDIAIRHCVNEPSEEDAFLISSSPMFPYASANHEPCDNPKDLLNHSLLSEDNGALWKKWFANAGVDFADIQTLSQPLSYLLAIEGALTGVGIALISTELAARDVEIGRLQRLSDCHVVYGGYYLMTDPENAKRKRNSEFRKWLLDATSNFRSA